MVWAMRDLPMPGSPEDIGLAVTPAGAMTISNSVMNVIFRRNDGGRALFYLFAFAVTLAATDSNAI
jgi:hypothetical protein